MQKVAGGRSVAQTTGISGVIDAPRRGATSRLAPFQGANHFHFLSGGLRSAATTGYYLAPLQGDHPPQNAQRPQANMLAKNARYKIDQTVITANHTRLAASMEKRM